MLLYMITYDYILLYIIIYIILYIIIYCYILLLKPWKSQVLPFPGTSVTVLIGLNRHAYTLNRYTAAPRPQLRPPTSHSDGEAPGAHLLEPSTLHVN